MREPENWLVNILDLSRLLVPYIKIMKSPIKGTSTSLILRQDVDTALLYFRSFFKALFSNNGGENRMGLKSIGTRIVVAFPEDHISLSYGCVGAQWHVGTRKGYCGSFP